MSTTMLKSGEVARKWYVLDAAGKPPNDTAWAGINAHTGRILISGREAQAGGRKNSGCGVRAGDTGCHIPDAPYRAFRAGATVNEPVSPGVTHGARGLTG